MPILLSKLKSVHTAVYLALALALIASLASLLKSKKVLTETETHLTEVSTKVTELQQQVDAKEKELVSLKVDKQKTTTITKKDGTKIVVQEETKTDKTTEVDAETRVDTQSKQTVVDTKKEDTRAVQSSEPALSKYSLALDWAPLEETPGLLPSYAPVAASVGARLGGLPFWGQTGVMRDGDHVFWTIGLRYEW